jgi:starch synthase (maltosyl-transferring)
VVNLDPYHTQSAWVHVPTGELGLGDGPESAYQVHDLIGDARYLWHGETNFVKIDPFASPAHVFRVRRRVKSERDFDYYM